MKKLHLNSVNSPLIYKIFLPCIVLSYCFSSYAEGTLSSFAIERMVSVEATKTAKIIHLHLISLNDLPRSEALRKKPFKEYDITVIEQRRIHGPPPKQRNPELSSEQLVAVALDALGQEITKVVIPDPRLIRAETADPSGKLTSSGFIYQASTDLIIPLPDDSRITTLKIYHPRWTGKKFILAQIGEVQLP